MLLNASIIFGFSSERRINLLVRLLSITKPLEKIVVVALLSALDLSDENQTQNLFIWIRVITTERIVIYDVRAFPL